MVKKETDHFLKNDELGWSVWKSKYARPNEDTPDDMHRRLAKEFARIEEKYKESEVLNSCSKKLSNKGYSLLNKGLNEEEIYNRFKDFKYIVPQGSIMSMLGSDQIGSLSNCFVIGQPHDSYGGIMQKDEELVQLMKRRGGVGIDISTLRPLGTEVTNAAKTSTGAASFMERYSNSTREVAQGGRRGALMLTIDVRHPDVLQFINAKKDRTKVTGANISVMLRDDFMEAVKKDEDYILRFPCDAEFYRDNKFPGTIPMEYNKLIEGNLGYYKKVKAKEIYDSIVENAWENAEPGQMFVDRHHSYSPDSVYPQYKGVTTNPCGEIFMQPYDSCRLFALNLYSFVKNPFTDKATFDFELLYQMAYEQQRLADDLIDLELEHISRILAKIHSDDLPDEVKRVEIELWEKVFDVAQNGRRTGCGFTALGDTLAALNIKYDEGHEMIGQIMYHKMKGELDCTIDLAILRGSFDGWNKHKEFFNDELGYNNSKPSHANNSFYRMLLEELPEQADRMYKYGRRNISWSTCAPTGSVSLLTQTSSGLEPLFQPYYMRRKKINSNDKDSRVDFTDQNGDKWQEFPILHPKFKEWLYTKGLNDKDYLTKDTENLSSDSLKRWFELSPWYGSTANDIDWIKRVEIQAIIQKYTSHSISSTINLPENVTKEEVSEIYMRSYESGLKGVTIYRDNCRTGVLVNTDSKKEEVFEQRDAPKRPEVLPVDIHTTVASGNKWNVIIGLFNKKPYEVFVVPYFTSEEHLHLKKLKSSRYDLLKDGETYSENITSEMNDEQEMITRLLSTSLRHGADITFLVEQLSKTSGGITSFGKALTRVLKRYANTERLIAKQECTDCGSTNLIFEEGCLKCRDCGSSKCG